MAYYYGFRVRFITPLGAAVSALSIIYCNCAALLASVLREEYGE